jgi:hypothetical protein
MDIAEKLWKCAQLCVDNAYTFTGVMIAPEKGHRCFTLRGRSGISLPNEHEKDKTRLYVDCLSRRITYWAADESPHNGDYYGDVHGELDWERNAPAVLARIEPFAIEAMRGMEKKEREEEERARLLAKIYG